MAILWRKDNGKPHFFEYGVDEREALAGGHYDSTPPQSSTAKETEFSGAELEKVAVLAEKDRLGSSIEDADKALLEDFQASEGKLSPLAPQVVPAPESTEVADTFHPATASREELFDWLRKQGDEPGNALSTANLRQRAVDKIGPKS